MTVRSFSERDLRHALWSTGIDDGDLVIVHSALFALGRIQGVPIKEIPSRLYSALRNQVGPEGTIAVPCFNFDFCHGEPFDRQHTPSRGMGAFSEYIRQLPEARRSPHPMQSMAAVGSLADELAARDTPGAFEERSAFDALIEYDGHILMVGCGINAVSMVHWAEEKVGVPYRYQKKFTGPYHDGEGRRRRTYRMYVRDLELDPCVRLDSISRILRRRGELRRLRLGAGSLMACKVRHFISAAVQLLQRDPNALIHNSIDDPGRPHV